MKEIEGHFDGLVFAECELGQARVDEATVTIPVRGLFVSRDHPLARQRTGPCGTGPYEGELVFSGVVVSRRRMTEYARGSRGSEDSIGSRFEVKTFAGPDPDIDKLHEFAIDGNRQAPQGRVDDWLIHASGFKLCVR